ncbi:NAD(+) kinase [Aphelenchoides fujianensis]|nr:NAD(+) kinase [Aphelenchoides fujianensis]
MLEVDRNGCCAPLAPKTRRGRRLHRSPVLRVTLLSAGGGEYDAEHVGDENENVRSIDATAASSVHQTFCAFNDIFIAEESAVRVSYMEIRFDDGPTYKQKNSGLELSVARDLQAAAVDEWRVREVFELMSGLGYKLEPPAQPQPVDRLCEQLNQTAGEKNKMTYALKEPVFNSTFETIPQRGSAQRIWIKSKGTNAQLLLDGSTCVPFGYGAEILVEYEPETAMTSSCLFGM